jgi:hypothetical protein
VREHERTREREPRVTRAGNDTVVTKGHVDTAMLPPMVVNALLVSDVKPAVYLLLVADTGALVCRCMA